MAMGQAEYLYGRYWERGVSAPPEHDPTTPRRIVLLKRALKGLAPGAKVLDAGCGGGIFLREMISWGFDVTGTDISQGALTLAASRAPGARLVQAELGMRLPFNDSEFQAIFSTETIAHVLDTETLFAEFRRILTDGGLLILTTPYHGLVKNLLIALFAFDKHYSPLGTHLRYYTRRSLEAVLTAYGFRVERVTGVGRIWPLWKSIWVEARKR